MRRSVAVKSVDCRLPRSGSIRTSSARQQRALPRGLALHHDRDRLVRDRERRGQLLAADRLEADVDGDDDVDAHRLRDVDRQVLDEAAVDQQPAVDLDRREDARRRHARAHRGGRGRRSSSTTRAPVSRSAATARNGVGSSSKSSIAATGSVSSRSVCVRRWPWISPRGTRKLPLWMPSGKRTRNSRSSCLRRKLSVLRAGRSRNATLQSMPRISSSISLGVMPEAYRPPTTAPMLVPAIASIGDVQLLERLEHADVREAARAAAGEHEPDARTRGFRGFGSAATAGTRDARPPSKTPKQGRKTEHFVHSSDRPDGSTGAAGRPVPRLL